MSSTDRIEKQLTLRSPVSRVWRAITDAREFGRWFGVELDGPFVVGATVSGRFSEGLTEALVVEQQKRLGLSPSRVRLPGRASLVFCTVERIEPEQVFGFRWVPYGIDAEATPENEPTTLVELHLEPLAEGTRLTITESGFDRVPAHRRERALRMNDAGWAGQAQNVKRFVEDAAHGA